MLLITKQCKLALARLVMLWSW